MFVITRCALSFPSPRTVAVGDVDDVDDVDDDAADDDVPDDDVVGLVSWIIRVLILAFQAALAFAS